MSHNILQDNFISQKKDKLNYVTLSHYKRLFLAIHDVGK